MGLVFFLFAFLNLQCAHQKSNLSSDPEGPKGHADAVLEAKSGHKSLKGQLHFMGQKGVLTVRGEIQGLKPNSKHGFHIHEFGDCSKADASSAGGHFSPNKGNVHAGHNDPNRHAGDLGNLQSDAQGSAKVELNLPGLNLNSGEDTFSIANKAVIVHADPDDLVSQPAGNAGVRIGCGVIKTTNH